MPWYAYILYAIFGITCLIIIGSVLLQSGKGDAAVFGGGWSQATFGARGAQKPLERTTFIAAGMFMLLAFVFSIPGVLSPRPASAGIEDIAPTPKVTQPKPEPTPAPQAPQSTTPAETNSAITKPSEEAKENVDKTEADKLKKDTVQPKPETLKKESKDSSTTDKKNLP